MNSPTPNPPTTSLFRRLYPLLIQFWMAAVLLGFFIVRILGSGLGRRILSAIGIHPAP